MKHTMNTLLLFLCVILLGCAQPGEVRSASETDDLDQIRELLSSHPKLVLNVLRENPEELLDILEHAVQVKRGVERQKQEQADLAMERNPLIDQDRPIRGSEDAVITIVEYSDFQCPYCSQAADTMKALMAADNKGELRLVFKHLPLNPASRELALAFEAVALQSHAAAWKLHDMLFERQAEVRGGVEAALNKFVAELDIDLERFVKDRQSAEVAALIQMDMDEASRFEFSGTPMFLVNGIAVRGAVPIQEFQRIIELARAKSPLSSADE